MIKPLSINRTHKVFFWSDIHLNHAKDFILEPRGFKDATEAKETLINRWNKTVSNNDIGFLLGDNVVGAGVNSEEEFVNLLLRLNYNELFVMPGNHPAGYNSVFNKLGGFIESDCCIKGYGKVEGAPFLIDNYYRLSFEIANKTIHLIPNYYEITIEGQYICCSHYPVLSWNQISKGAYMLFGHVHKGLEKVDWVKNNYLKGRVLDIGIENCLYPIEFAELQKYMQNQKLLKVDHH